jgi:hypothetical protein
MKVLNFKFISIKALQTSLSYSSIILRKEGNTTRRNKIETETSQYSSFVAALFPTYMATGKT